jgi:hypothetical protein
LFAGEEIGEDLGYGPPRLLSDLEVRSFATYLSSKPDDFVEQAMDFVALEAAEIYPTIWDRQDPEDIVYVADYFRTLRKFFREAAVAGDVVVVALT